MKKGFTLLELIVVIIVIGILASIALPRFLEVTEKARSGEALGMLNAMRSSQIRYRAQGSAYALDIANLDVSFTTARYFTASVPAAIGGDDAVCATVTRNTGVGSGLPTGWGGYWFTITANGTVVCTPSGGAGGVNECARLGY